MIWAWKEEGLLVYIIIIASCREAMQNVTLNSIRTQNWLNNFHTKTEVMKARLKKDLMVLDESIGQHIFVPTLFQVVK